MNFPERGNSDGDNDDNVKDRSTLCVGLMDGWLIAVKYGYISKHNWRMKSHSAFF